MVVVSILPRAEFGRNDHWEDAHHFIVIFGVMNLYIFEGFGVAAKSTMDCRKADPMNIVGFHQADVGEYIRSEDTLI